MKLMSEKTNDVDVYLATLSGQEKDWVEFFVEYMRAHHADLEEVMSFQMPTFKLGSGKLRNYIAFSPAKHHFSMHSMDFDYIALLKEKLTKPGKGKGCVNVRYEDLSERTALLDGIEQIVARRVLGTYGT